MATKTTTTTRTERSTTTKGLALAASVDAFAAAPVGACVAGRSWLHWCASPTLFGVHLWGRPDEDDVKALVVSLAVELGDGVVPHASLVDASGVVGADLGSFSVLNGYVSSQSARLSQQVTKLALVRPGGLEGAVVAGFYQVLKSPYPVQLFDDAAPALAWLGSTPPSLLEQLTSLLSAVRGVDALVRSLRAVIVADLVDVDAARAAKALGLSERTLQRRLQEANTTFLAELGTVRIEEAQRRMLDSDAPLTAIAVDVGFSSLQHFSAAFRKSTGETPSAWRQQQQQQRR